MSNIGKVTGALLSASQETTFALVNANIDFSLVRFESPEEYRGLGVALSADRRKTAEDGPFHVIARRLGALFEEVLPQAPHLIRAYGIRVSKIAENPIVNPRGTPDHGFFKDHIGADGTSIWAAATSSTAAIGVHMLACMIARFWKNTEAIAIWIEMIETRKKQLAERATREPSNLSALWAARIPVSRQDVGNWDTSARAWLETADNAMRAKHTQLMLIAQNINLPVNTKMTTYEGVISAIKAAMTTVDRLINGMPQSPQDGATLLGLSAWHFYPDMLVLGAKTVEVKQNDELVTRGGQLTLGLQIGPDSTRTGLHWSLPLAHLRYYGDPVRSERTLVDVGSRVSFSQFQLVILGACLSDWGEEVNDAGCCHYVRSVWRMIVTDQDIDPLPWLSVLVRAAEVYEEAQEPEKTMLRQLISLGRRRASNLLNFRHWPLFELHRSFTILESLQNRSQQIGYLRNIAQHLKLEGKQSLIIRFKLEASDVPSHYCLCHCHGQVFAYATAVPFLFHKKSTNGSTERDYGQVRYAPTFRLRQLRNSSYHQGDLSTRGCCRLDIHRGDPSINSRVENRAWIKKTQESLQHGLSVKGENFVQISCEEDAMSQGPDTPRQPEPTLFEFGRARSSPRQANRIIGNDYSIGLYVLWDPGERYHGRLLLPWSVDQSLLQDTLSVLQTNRLDRDAILQAIHIPQVLIGSNFGQQEIGLAALAAAGQIYGNFPEATVPLGVCMRTQPLDGTAWARSLIARQSKTLSRSEAFACITFFESGGVDLDPAGFDQVMAVCSGNSLFVSGALLQDPWEIQDGPSIRQLIGNVGKPGISLLVPPASPRVRQLEVGQWRQINHFAFQGLREDAFHATTLHLSFTDAETPVLSGKYGECSAEVSFIESLVSVHDRGK